MRHWPGRLAARRVLVAAGPWPAACRRGTQRLAGLRGGAAAAGRMASGVPAAGLDVLQRPAPAPATLTPVAARSSRLGSPWPPASRRAGPETLQIAIQPARRRGCALGAVALTSVRSRPAPQPAGLLHQRRRPPRDVRGGQPADSEHAVIRRPPWHRSSHTVLDPALRLSGAPDERLRPRRSSARPAQTSRPTRSAAIGLDARLGVPAVHNGGSGRLPLGAGRGRG